MEINSMLLYCVLTRAPVLVSRQDRAQRTCLLIDITFFSINRRWVPEGGVHGITLTGHTRHIVKPLTFLLGGRHGTCLRARVHDPTVSRKPGPLLLLSPNLLFNQIILILHCTIVAFGEHILLSL